MIKKLLIANRGEIACRIIRTAKRMGIATVAVYSEADTNALHVKNADQAIYIGESPATASYLNQKNIINAIEISGADAVHPGYGFLAENPDFALSIEKIGITFVGPSAQSIRSMGDKIEAKKIATDLGLSVVPGYIGAITSDKEALKIASTIGYPIMLKAAAGGGGKGIRVARSPEDVQQAFKSARSEARSNFADERTFIEKFIENPRHIEIQVFGDKYGNYVCLGERECSIQRSHQKIIEESPSPFIDEVTRQKMYAEALSLARKVGYYSAGTVEFIVDQQKKFYFMEMNTRLQVEHTVTELVTGLDLVELMIRVAAGEELPIKQEDVKMDGWAIEARICAEDPACGFIPSTGRIEAYREPEKSDNLRIDTGVYNGGEVSMFYDAMIAKLCTHAPTRHKAIEEMSSAFDNFIIRGISHNISFLQNILKSQRFGAGDLSTNFISEEYKDGFASATLNDENSAVMLCASLYIFLADLKRSMQSSAQFRGRTKSIGTRWVVWMNGVNYPVTAHPFDENGYKITYANRRFYITSKWVVGNNLFPCVINGKQYTVQVQRGEARSKLTCMGASVESVVFTPRTAELRKFMRPIMEDTTKEPEVCANLSGRVIEVRVAVGDKVTKGMPIISVEAMKMENILMARFDGIVTEVLVRANDLVTVGEVLIIIQENN